MTAENDKHEMSEPKQCDHDSKCRVGESLNFRLRARKDGGYWTDEPVDGVVIRRGKAEEIKLSDRHSSDFTFYFVACKAGQSTIRLLYLVDGMIKVIVTITVQVLPRQWIILSGK